MSQEKHPANDRASEPQSLSRKLLDWYDRHHRDLPWRTPPSRLARSDRPDPYRVWLSEVMLQQTTVEAVKPYFAAFTATWPDFEALAAADQDDVMRAWAGLGYYSRARNLHSCAKQVVSDHGGTLPRDAAALRALPGIGAYTSAAIASIAYGQPVAVVDGNVERVVARMIALDRPVREAKPAIAAWVAERLSQDRPGDFAQAMMDLGATICTPRRPSCILCPWRESCAALATGEPERFPVKPAKADRPVRTGRAFVAMRPDGAVLLRRRPDRGLLGGMAEVPNGGWDSSVADGTAAPPFAADWQPAGSIVHVFTHFELRLAVDRAVWSAQPPQEHWWSTREELPGEALPTVMKKIIEAAIPGATRAPR